MTTPSLPHPASDSTPAVPITRPSAATVEEMRDILEGLYLDGFCYLLAIVLHRRTGWTLIALRAADGRFVDVRGVLDEAGFRNGDAAPGSSAPIDVQEADLRAVAPFAEERLRMGEAHADLLFPDLPPSPRLARTEAFLRDLDALCRQHGIWIRAAMPGQRPIAYEAYGDEAGYGIHLLDDGTITFDRELSR